ncbi:hypothetical protein VPNG_07354 [Cytospora leucostoma]|uniref:F-box domain-containing protein n=1 Tax=Cytospora leucostoma TaxID=1230097 RepID=A0A423WUT2_9PEZI|nr:hypothetical protein VPNG_07354 [Cytospora leucostoma]
MATNAPRRDSGPGQSYEEVIQQQQQQEQQRQRQWQQQQHKYRPRWSLNDLSTELLTMIFEQLRVIDTRYVSSARLLCRWYNQLATPIAYRTVVLTERITSHDAEQRYSRALANIYAYTNHVVASSNLDQAGTRKILQKIRNLATVREVDLEQFWMPADVLNAEQTRHHNTRLYVEELPLREFEDELRDIYVRAIPVQLLVSLKTAYPSPPLVTRLNSLKYLLLASRRLEILHFEDRGQGTQFDFAPHERLPAFRELSLQSYDWRHTPEEVARHWDFSRITSLELISVPIYNFLGSVDFHDLANLRTLHCEDFSAHHPPEQRVEATRGLYVLIKSHIRALSSIKITVHTADLPIDALLPHAPYLTDLRLRDHTGFDEEDRRCPTLAHADLALLARHMRRLRTLELDMDTALADVPRFLKAACSFPSLHTLVLHVQTVLRPFGPAIVPGTDRDYEAAAVIFRFLVRHKVGCVPWRSVTINVGGWRRVLVRRLSEAWRSLNERGVFAERCFVMERREGPDGDGGLVVREEFPLEASRHVTPDNEGRADVLDHVDKEDDDDDDDDDNDNRETEDEHANDDG